MQKDKDILSSAITAAGNHVRELKAQKASKEQVLVIVAWEMMNMM
jgi:hypothetical protein